VPFPWDWYCSAMSEVVRAEMVANVAEVHVEVGDEVGAGVALVLVESMKMEIPVLCELGGAVTEVQVVPGDVIRDGGVIAVLG
jgi:acetyl-CoA carboxylase biotin carboxyl carrier protein